jgi:hypothetical protein
VLRVPVTFAAGLVLVAAVVLGVAHSAVAVVPDVPLQGRTGLLSECSTLQETKQYRCYIRGFLTMIDEAGDPATELPRIDTQVHNAGGFLEAACHPLMHTVGRTWAREHHVTFANLMRYTPRSNDPGCSAGFGMGLVMYLGPQLVLHPREVLATCAQLPTRFRRYTCIHGSGHALMRGFHSQLRDAVKACRTLGPRNAPDCAQGAFHDYWIALSGADGTTPLVGADDSAQSVCAGYEFARPCWFRFFWERRSDERFYEASDILHACNGLAGIQRAGCVSGASLAMARTREPVDHARTCGGLTGSDTIDCLRGVAVPEVANEPFERMRLIRTCASLPRTTRSRCFGWFGRTLAVVTDGRFLRIGCPRLGNLHARVWCSAGAEHMERPLRTFS